MKIIATHKRTCPCCMDIHDVNRVIVNENTLFKGVPLKYDAEYCYCEKADEYFAEEQQISSNDIAMKNAYRSAMGLMTTEQIVALRSMYNISQSDLCRLLGWGEKTIARYEGHQVQDKAHDMILRKIGDDPEWFLVLLEKSKDTISAKARRKYYEAGLKLLTKAHGKTPESVYEIKAEARRDTIIELVKDGLLTVEEGAARIGQHPDQIQELLNFSESPD